MSGDNVEIVRAAIEARNRGDAEAAMKDFDHGALSDWSESRFAEGGMVEAVLQGRDRLTKQMRDLFEMWESVVWDQVELLEVGDDQVLEVDTVHMRGRDGIEFTDRGAILWTFEGGKVVRVKFFPSKERALAALGD